MPPLVRAIVRRVFAIRIPANPIHRLLAWEWRLRRFALYELARVLYYQPMFESLCRRVGRGVHLEICPDSKVPAIAYVDLELADGVRLSARTTFSGAKNAPGRSRISIGDRTYLGHRVVLRAGTEIAIGRDVLIASGALLSGDPGHPTDPVARRTEAAPRESLGRIVVGDDVWLAYNATVLGNVRIGEGAIVGAGAVVVEDVPPYSVVAGNPAKVVKHLRRNVAVGVPGVAARPQADAGPDGPAGAADASPAREPPAAP